MDINSTLHLQYISTLKWFAFILLALFFIGGSAGTMFSKAEEEVIIFSPMEGLITMNGQPVANAKIERWLKWKNEEGEKDYFYTDEAGQFRIPVKKDIVRLSTISQFVMAQELRVFVEGVEYAIWAKAKREKGLYDELEGKPVNFRCELTDELVPVRAGRGTLVTSCKWDLIE